MSIRTKILGGSLLLLFLYAVTSTLTYMGVQKANERLALIHDVFLPLFRDLVQVQGHLHTLSEDIRRFKFRADFNSESSTFTRMARDLYPYLIEKRLVQAEDSIHKFEARIPSKVAVYWAQGLVDIRKGFQTLLKSPNVESFEQQLKDLRSKIQVLSQNVDAEGQEILLSAQREGDAHLWRGAMLSMVVSLFALFALWMSHQTLNPLPHLIQSIRKIANGQLNESLKVKASDKDEVATLAREYNKMLQALQDRDRKIQLQQQELLQSERLAAVGQLSAEIVHEIRNPLNSISLNIDWIHSEISNQNVECQKVLESISKEIERLNQITEGYLVRARLPSHHSPKTELNDLIKEVLSFSSEEIRNQNIQIEPSLSDQPIFVATDRSKLKQVFLNLLKNAREAMPRGGNIRIRTSTGENISTVEIEDTGHGMNETTKSKSYTPFFTTKAGGTGLGLTLVRSLIEEANGTLSCDSKLGVGTLFRIQLPVAA